MYDCIYWQQQRSTCLIVYFGEYKYNNQTERGKFSYSVLVFFFVSNISPLLVRVLHLSLVTALPPSKPVISPRASVIRLRRWMALNNDVADPMVNSKDSLTPLDKEKVSLSLFVFIQYLLLLMLVLLFLDEGELRHNEVVIMPSHHSNGGGGAGCCCVDKEMVSASLLRVDCFLHLLLTLYPILPN